MIKDDFTIVRAMVDRAEKEIAMDKDETGNHPYWSSGHKEKAKRAIQTAREILLEIRKGTFPDA